MAAAHAANKSAGMSLKAAAVTFSETAACLAGARAAKAAEREWQQRMQQQEQQWAAKHKDLEKRWAARSASFLHSCLKPPLNCSGVLLQQKWQ